jgi:hypothetical protein
MQLSVCARQIGRGRRTAARLQQGERQQQRRVRWAAFPRGEGPFPSLLSPHSLLRVGREATSQPRTQRMADRDLTHDCSGSLHGSGCFSLAGEDMRRSPFGSMCTGRRPGAEPPAQRLSGRAQRSPRPCGQSSPTRSPSQSRRSTCRREKSSNKAESAAAADGRARRVRPCRASVSGGLRSTGRSLSSMR